MLQLRQCSCSKTSPNPDKRLTLSMVLRSKLGGTFGTYGHMTSTAANLHAGASMGATIPVRTTSMTLTSPSLSPLAWQTCSRGERWRSRLARAKRSNQPMALEPRLPMAWMYSGKTPCDPSPMLVLMTRPRSSNKLGGRSTIRQRSDVQTSKTQP